MKLNKSLVIKILKSRGKFVNFKTFVLSVLVLNVFTFYYFYKELSILKERVQPIVLEEEVKMPEDKSETDVEIDFNEELGSISNELDLINKELMGNIKSLDNRYEEINKRVLKLEKVSGLLGEVLGACEVVPKAYWKFKPASGYDSELNSCASSYQKLKGDL